MNFHVFAASFLLGLHGAAVIPSMAHTAVCSVPMANLVLLVLLLELMLEVSLLPGFRMLDLIGPAWRLPAI